LWSIRIMPMTVDDLPEEDKLPEDYDALKVAFIEMRAKVLGAEALIEHLRLVIAKMKREIYGPRSERSQRLLDQLELQLEDMIVEAGKAKAEAERTNPVQGHARRANTRRNFPDHLPRRRIVHPAPTCCPCCGGDKLSKIGEDVTKTLDVVPRQMFVTEHVREKFSCRSCEKISQPPAPFHAIPRGYAGPSLLAMIMVDKYANHQPLNRQSEQFAREGVELSVSTMADHVGACAAALLPLFELIKHHVFAAERLHGDDTTVPVLAKGKTRTGRLWTYVRDDRPFAGHDPPAAAFFYSPDRSGTHPEAHLAGYIGLMQADAYAGFNRLYEPLRKPGPIVEVGCWAHARRKFFEIARLNKAPIAIEAVEKIDVLFAIEREINGVPQQQRAAMRNERSRPLVKELCAFLRERRAKLSGKSETAKAIDYSLKRWEVFTRFLDDGRLCMSNNAAERELRAVAMPESLCIPSLSVCKHWNRVGIVDATRATLSGHRRFDRFRRQVFGANLVWRARHHLHRRQYAGFNQTAYHVTCDAQRCCRFGQGQPFAILFRRSVGMDTAHAAN
jgi:transposase